jgi:hypothetical protein
MVSTLVKDRQRATTVIEKNSLVRFSLQTRTC